MLSSPQRWVRPAETTDAAMLEDWLAALRPLPVPEARARRLALDALLAQSGQGLCVMAGANTVQALLPATLIHDLSHAGRVAIVADWWCAQPAAEQGEWFSACVDLLADWCRAHGIRHVLVAPALLPGDAMPAGCQPDASGLWRRSCIPAAKSLV